MTPLWVQIAILALGAISLALHASHRKGLQSLGDDVDVIKAAVTKELPK